MSRHWPKLILSILWMSGSTALAAPPTPEALRGVEVTDRAGLALDLGLTLADAEGAYTLTDRLVRGKPTLLTFNYFRCRGVCDLQLRMIARDLPAWGLKADDDFNLVSLSFDPEDTPVTAEARRDVLSGELERATGRWHLGVGNAEEVLELAAEAGVRIERVADTDQWAHPAVAVVLTPEGVISSYLGGVRPEVRDVRFALVGASRGELGTLADFVWMSCFSYDPDSGSYVPEAWKIMRLGGLMTVLLLAAWLGYLWRSKPTLKEVPC
jgi:protein SCO1/2